MSDAGLRAKWLLGGMCLCVVGVSIWLSMSLKSPDIVRETDGRRQRITRLGGLLSMPAQTDLDPHIHTTTEVRDRLKIKVPLPKGWSLATLYEASKTEEPGRVLYVGHILVAGNPLSPARVYVKTITGTVDVHRGLIIVHGVSYAGDGIELRISPKPGDPTENDCTITLTEPN